MVRSFLFLVAVLIGTSSSASAAGFPNILVILADDLGYGDLRCYSAVSKVPTPHVDRLATEGMRFTDAHSPATVCTPSRYALLTGRMCFRTGVKGVLTGVDGPLIEPGRLTLPAILKQKGYDTACVGKWHVGMTFFQPDGTPVAADGGGLEKVRLVDFSRPFTNGPLDTGFDYFFGTACCPTTDWLYAYLENDRVIEPPKDIVEPEAKHWLEYEFFRTGLKAPGFDFREADLVFLKKSKAFLEEHARERPDRPFFLYHATQAVHLPALPAQEFVGQTEAGPLGDFIAEFDHVVGELLNTLERLKLAENTLVILTSDNGPEIVATRMREEHGHDSARPWRGLKRDNWEGGHRVPFIARWPGRIPAGTTSDETLCLTDILATCAAIVGEKVPADAGEDSFDMLPALLAVRGKSHPWPCSTWPTMEKAEVFHGRQTPHRAADDVFHSPLDKASDAPSPLRPFVIHQTMTNKLAIRNGRWKLLDHRDSGGNDYVSNPMLRKYHLPDTDPEAPGQLYDLGTDPGETQNVYSKHPDVVAHLKGQLEQAKQSGRSVTRRDE